jgi:beta-phosphoglucomutase-like phosphatase (HAD superfamily)
MMFMTIKAIIFDLDGVIADTEHLSEKATVEILSNHGIHMTEDEKYRAFGRKIEEIFADALNARKMKMDIKKLMKGKDEIFEKAIKKDLRPIRNSIGLVKFLKDKGYKVGLATSSHMRKMVLELRILGIEDLFDAKMSGDHVRKGKPDPEIYLKAAKRLGVKPEECAVIEDSAFGVQAGKNAKMFAIGFRSPNSLGQDLSGADMVVDNLKKIERYFENQHFYF